MNNYSKIYWLTRLEPIHTGLVIMMIVSAFLLFGYILFNSLENASLGNNKTFKVVTTTFLIISSLALIFVPTRNEMIMIYAGGTTLDYVDKDTSLQKLPYQATKIVSTIMQNEVDKLTGKQKENQ